MPSYASATPVLALVLVSMLVALYLIYWFRMMEPPQDRKRCRAYGRAREWPEYFEEGEVPVDSPPNPDPAPAVTAVEGVATSPLQMQDAIDFSDMYVTEQNKTDAIQEGQDTQQIQSINDRFRAAKRNVVEFKMKNGVYTNKQRRQLVESLLRRAPCGRRVRSWRTENSDFLRGDVRPKGTSQSSNIIRSAKNNPDIDLHPGALGPMAGLKGQWLSEENLPGNIFADLEAMS